MLADVQRVWKGDAMQLVPRYGDAPVITVDLDHSVVAAAAIRQRSRVAATIATFDDEQWSHASRCAGWSVRDVIVHLESTNAFWQGSIQAGLAGRPTQFLATFDPVSSPAQFVAASPVTPAELVASFEASTEALVALWTSLDDDGWRTLAEGPPGHMSTAAVAVHALWDSWVHERDVALPLGLQPVVDDDEVTTCLRYAAGMGTALAINAGLGGTGSMVVRAADPDSTVRVDVDDHVTVTSGDGGRPADLTLHGPAVELLEAFSVRTPFPHPVPAEQAWMVTGLATVFDNP